MDFQQIEAKTIEILKELCGVDSIFSSDKLQKDLGLDSLGLVSMLLLIEEGFEITLNESDMNPFDLITVSDVCVLLERYV